MTIRKKRSTILKWVAGVLLSLLLILCAAAVYLGSRWKPLLREKITESVHTASGGLYRIEFKDLHVNLFTGSVTFDSLKLLPDTAVFYQLKAKRKAPSHLFTIRMANLKLSRIQVLTTYFQKKLYIRTIVLNKPSIDMVYHKVIRQADTLREERTLYEQLSKTLKSVQVGHIQMADADFDYYNGKKKQNAVKHLTVNIRDILIDSLSQYDSTRVLYAKNIGFELNGYRSVTKDKMYRMTIDSLSGSVNSHTLKIRNLKLTPLYPDLTFSRKYTIQKDRYDLSFPAIDMTGVDFVRLNNEGTVYARRLSIDGAAVAVFLNRELPPPSMDKGRNYPHNALKRLPFPAIVDTVSLKGVNVAYTEFHEQTKERGTLRLENLEGDILNVTNDSLRLTQNHYTRADLKTSIMGAARLNITINFNLTQAAAPFHYKGSVQPFSMTVLNPLSKPLGQIAIESGRVNHVDFDIQANERRSEGIVHFTYSDLKVNLLKKEEGGKTTEKGVLSFLANTLLVKNDNPEKGKEARVAHVQFSRVPQASFFNLMWKSIFSGIREIAGIGIVPMKNPPPPKKK